MKRKNKKAIFLSSLLGCSTLITSGLILSSCSGNISAQNFNKIKPISTNPTTSIPENDLNNSINLNPTTTKNELIENKDNDNESSITSTQDDSDKLSTTQNDNKNNSISPLSKNDAILKTIEEEAQPLKHKIGWCSNAGNSFTINLKSINGNNNLFKDENKNSIPINLRLFVVNLPYKLKLKCKTNNQHINTTGQGNGNYYAEYDYDNLELNYVYNSNVLQSMLEDNYFDGNLYGHHLYSNYGFRFNKNYTNNDSEITFDINLPPVRTPVPKNCDKPVTQPYEFTKETTFYTSGYIFIVKWWKGQLSVKEDGAKSLENKLKESLKKYLNNLCSTKNNSTSSSNNSLSSFFIKHNNSDATNDPINHWNPKKDGKFYGQWIADTIFREELKNKK